MPRILGIDPGSRITGFGVIEVDMPKQRERYVTSGCIRIQAKSLPLRLQEIFQSLTQIIQTYQPTTLAIEQAFVHRNVAVALKLGQVRGVIIVAAVQQGLTVFEYSPNQVKQSVVGYGHATKEQIQQMVKTLLCLSAVPQVDAADALAISLCHAHHGICA